MIELTGQHWHSHFTSPSATNSNFSACYCSTQQLPSLVLVGARLRIVSHGCVRCFVAEFMSLNTTN